MSVCKNPGNCHNFQMKGRLSVEIELDLLTYGERMYTIWIESILSVFDNCNNMYMLKFKKWFINILQNFNNKNMY